MLVIRTSRTGNDLGIASLAPRLKALAAAPAVTLTAVRHGQSTLNAAGLITGQLDPPLTALGRDQAAALRASLAGNTWDVRLHSGSRRTRETFELVAAGTPLPTVRTDARFQERAYGALEGLPAAAWEQPDDIDVAPPGGESYRQLGMRVFEALTDVVGCAADQRRPLNVLLIAHSGVLRILSCIEAGSTDMSLLLGAGPSPGQSIELRYVALTIPSLFDSPS